VERDRQGQKYWNEKEKTENARKGKGVIVNKIENLD
jgi:hypothetical protein